MASFGTSNKFAVLQLQQPHQPKPKGDKLINSVIPSVPKKGESENEKQKNENNNNNNSNNNNNNRRGGENRGRGGNRGGSGGSLGRGGSRVDRTDKTDQNAKRNKRIYDRNSNVPKNEVKKAGTGTGNWGTEKDIPRGLEDAKKEQDVDINQQPPVENKEEQNIVVEQEPEDKTITLKEYQQQLAALAPKIDAPKRREAGEGEKNSDLHKLVILKKEEDEDMGLPALKPKKEKAKKQAKKQVIPLTDLIVPPNNGEDRRARGKGDRPYNKKQKIKVNLAIEDTDSFPALK